LSNFSNFFKQEEKDMIISEIRKAEALTSGEIKLRIEKKAGENPMKSARIAFSNLGMRKTKLRNGVLFFLAIEDRKFVILGDNGINKRVPKDFWNNTRDIMQEHFQKGEFVQGLTEGVRLAGEQLSKFFPCDKNDVNELSDSISFEIGEENYEK